MHTRRQERDELARMIKRGKSIQMLGPRRIGKTWLIDRLHEDFTRENWLVVKVDLQGMTTEEEFLRALCTKLAARNDIGTRLKTQVMQRLDRILSGNVDGDWIAAISKVSPSDYLPALIAGLHQEEKNVLILIDEIALFVAELLRRNPDAARALLYNLRRLQLDYGNVRWLLTGSIGLDVVARRHGLLGALVDMEIFPLETFTESQAHSYLGHLRQQDLLTAPFSLDPAALTYLVAQLGWLSPYYLELIATRIRPTGQLYEGFPRATAQDIDKAFAKLLEPTCRTFFSTWEEHISKNFPSEQQDLLHAILEACCVTPEGEVAGALLARLHPGNPGLRPRELKNHLTALANDGLLMFDNERWRFRSGLLRRYWQRYFGE